MSNSITADNFHGIDWHTTQVSLARILTLLDGMQTLALGFIDEFGIEETDQLKVLAEMANEARVELDFVAAEYVGTYPANQRMMERRLQTAWSLVEADELICAVRDLSNEARAAMRHQNLDEMPDTVALDLSENLRRIKLLLTSIDDMPVAQLARA